MSLNSFGGYVGTHKVWDHVGNMIPKVEHSEGIRPSAEWKPAAWLPVQFYDKHFENWMVTLPGKVVAADNNGDLVPAQYGLTGATITYTANDVDAGVTDVRTGAALLSGDVGTFNVSAVSAFMGGSDALAVGNPIGVAPYAYLQWAGGDGSNPVNYRQHNYNMQHQVAVLCDYVLELPVVPATTSSESLTFGAADGDNIADSSALSALPVATNTARTPMSFAGGNSATVFVTQVTTRALVNAAGLWYVDTATGIISVYASVALTNMTATYYNYATAPASVSKFACAVGNLKTGDLLVVDSNSNFKIMPAGNSDAALDSNMKLLMGQVIHKITYPRSGLDRVRTAFNPAIGTDATGLKPGSSGQSDQMPGSATGGVPDYVNYAGAADQTVLINLISR